MTEAVLRLRTEGGAEVTRLLAEIERATKATDGRVRATRARSRQQDVSNAAQAAKAEGQVYRTAAREIERADQLVTRAKLRELALQGAARKRFTQAYIDAEKQATAALEQELGKRGSLTQREKKQVETLALAIVASRERAEREVTAATERESRRRAAIERRNGENLHRAGGIAAHGTWDAVGRAQETLQSARERRAHSEHTINSALYQAGIGGAEAQGMRQDIYATAQRLGMDSGEMADALNRAQTRFSVLTSSDPAERRRGLNEQLSLAELAQNTYQDPAEVMQAAGMLRQQGLSERDRRQVLMGMTGMAHFGSVQLSTMISQGLGPLMQNIAARTNGSMTEAQRAAAVRSTTLETMAIGEIGVAAGLTPRDAMNATAKFRRGFQSERVAERMFNSLSGRVGEARAAELVERTQGPGGRQTFRFRSDNTVQNMTQLNRLMGGDTNAALNMLQGGGHGTPMVVDAQMRRLFGSLNSQTSGGQTVSSKVGEMLRAGERYDEHDVERGRQMVQGEQQTMLHRAEEQRDAELVDNSKQLQNLSTTIRDWQTRNPLLMAAGVPAAAALAKGVGAAAGGGAGTGLGILAMAGGSLANMRAIATGETVDGRHLSAGNRAGRLWAGMLGTAMAPLTGGASLAGAFAPGLSDTARAAGHSEPGNAVLQSILNALPERFARALRDNPPIVQASQHDIVAAHTVATTRNAGPR